MKLIKTEFAFVGLCIEGFLYGLYSGIFATYLKYHASRKEASDNTIIFYALCVLYILCGLMFTIDTAAAVISHASIIHHISIIQTIVFAFCDFLAQCILIYRCWIVWSCNIYVAIIPSIFAFGFLATWIGGTSIMPAFTVQGRFVVPGQSNMLAIAGLVLSMTVNALVMGLIVFRIFEVFREVKGASTPDGKTLGITGGRKLWSVMFIIIESGMALFSIQLARIVVSTSLRTTANFNAFVLIVGINEMLNGITPTIILVRVSMGLSFYDEASMVESAGNFLCFAPDVPTPISETGSISQDDSLSIASDPISETGNISEQEGDGGSNIRMVER